MKVVSKYISVSREICKKCEKSVFQTIERFTDILDSMYAKYASRVSPWFIVGILLVSGLVLRGALIHILPVTNDEGSYFYDGYLINQGYIPYKDFLTKSLPHIYAVAFFTSIFGNTIFAGRVLSLVLFLVNGILVFFIGKKLLGRKAAVLSLATFSLYPEIAVLTTYSQTQNIQLAFGLFFVHYMLSKKYTLINMVVMALLAMGAYIARPTAVIYIGLFVVYLLLQVWQRKISIKKAMMRITFLSAVFIGIGVVLFAVVQNYIGFYKAFDFFGLEMVIQGNASIDNTPVLFSLVSKLFSNTLILSRFLVRTPLLLVSILFIIALSLHRRLITPKVGALFLLTLLLFTASTFSNFLRVSVVYFTSHFIEHALLFMLFAYLIHFLSQKFNSSSIRKSSSLILILFWMFSLFVLYGFWIKFRVPYIIEFFPVISLMIGYLFFYFEENGLKSIKVMLVLILGVSVVFSQLRSFTLFYTGTYSPDVVKEVGIVIEENSDPDDTILTAALVFPYVTERNIVSNISHPYWLGYVGFDEELLTLYMPPLDDIEQDIVEDPPQLIVYDVTTKETFFDQSEGLDTWLEESYELIYKATDVEVYKHLSTKNQEQL